jgi:outer membrane protein
MRLLLAMAIAAVVAVATIPARAADPGGWTVTLGAKAGVMPDYEGSNRYVFRPTPLFDIRPAGTPPRFKSPRESIGLGLYEQGPLRAGIVGKIRFPRKEGDDADLRGLGDVNWGAEVGASSTIGRCSGCARAPNCGRALQHTTASSRTFWSMRSGRSCRC